MQVDETVERLQMEIEELKKLEMAIDESSRKADEALKKLETAEYVALMLKMSKPALYEAVRRGLVPHVRIGKRIRFDLDAIERWLESGGSPWGDSGSGYVNRWSN